MKEERVPSSPQAEPAQGEEQGPGTGTVSAASPPHALRFLVSAFLVILPVAALWPVLSGEFVDYDDPPYVTENPVVRGGLSMRGILWAFTTGHSANWHPVTWLSHMLDVSLFGLDPRGHHATNLLLHVVNTLLLFLLFRKATGKVARSAMVAALFAVHPAHVESVAWVTERKDVLSTAFWLATMLAYVGWVRRRGAGRFGLVLLLFALGLMSKPMLVSLPIVLLLFDFWPLHRFVSSPGESRASLSRRRIVEKIPLLLIAAASSLVTFLVQRASGAVMTLETFPLRARLENAAVSTVAYLKMLVWPSDLSVFYPHPGTSLSTGQVLLAALALLTLSAFAFRLRRSAPWAFLGWFWFFITLLPVIGIVQVGIQAMADRYTYVPFIGLFVAVVWSVAEAARAWRFRSLALRAAAGVVIAGLALAARAQARVWKTTETLMSHAIAVTKENFPAQNNLGHYYNDRDRPAEALPHLLEALRIRKCPEVYVNIGRSMFLMSRLDEAEQYFSKAISLAPGDWTAISNLARVRFLQGDVAGAIRLYEDAVAKAPGGLEIRKSFSIPLFVEGRTSEALAQLQRVLAADPQDAESRQLLEGGRAFAAGGLSAAPREFRRVLATAHRQVGDGLFRHGRNTEAIDHLHRAIEAEPAMLEGHNDLGRVLTQTARFEEAAAEFRRVIELEPRLAMAHNNLGYALFRLGHRESAIVEYKSALELEPGLEMAKKNLRIALSAPDHAQRFPPSPEEPRR